MIMIIIIDKKERKKESGKEREMGVFGWMESGNMGGGVQVRTNKKYGWTEWTPFHCFIVSVRQSIP